MTIRKRNRVLTDSDDDDDVQPSQKRHNILRKGSTEPLIRNDDEEEFVHFEPTQVKEDVKEKTNVVKIKSKPTSRYLSSSERPAEFSETVWPICFSFGDVPPIPSDLNVEEKNPNLPIWLLQLCYESLDVDALEAVASKTNVGSFGGLPLEMLIRRLASPALPKKDAKTVLVMISILIFNHATLNITSLPYLLQLCLSASTLPEWTQCLTRLFRLHDYPYTEAEQCLGFREKLQCDTERRAPIRDRFRAFLVLLMKTSEYESTLTWALAKCHELRIDLCNDLSFARAMIEVMIRKAKTLDGDMAAMMWMKQLSEVTQRHNPFINLLPAPLVDYLRKEFSSTWIRVFGLCMFQYKSLGQIMANGLKTWLQYNAQ